jgi:hypothetical protein
MYSNHRTHRGVGADLNDNNSQKAITQTGLEISSSLNIKYLRKGYIRSHFLRTVNKFSIDWEAIFKDLGSDIAVVDYFKRHHPFQEYKQLLPYLRKHPLFDEGYINGIRIEIANSRVLFLESLEKTKDAMSKHFTINVTETEHLVALSDLNDNMYGGATTTFRPSGFDVVSQINKSASAGSPTF